MLLFTLWIMCNLVQWFHIVVLYLILLIRSSIVWRYLALSSIVYARSTIVNYISPFHPKLRKLVSVQQIHTLVMSLSYTGIEIKTAHSLESWSGGAIVMVSGSVQIKDNLRRKFMQTFFLAPQEKGFFVLNDIFHFVEDDLIHHHHHQAVLLAQSNLDSKLNVPSTINMPGKVWASLYLTWIEKVSLIAIK